MNKSSGTIYHGSPEGVSLKEETNNKSSGTSSGAWMHRLRTKGWIYHGSPEGVSLKEETNNKSSGTCSGAWMHRLRTKGWNYHASPEGFYMDVDGRATHMYRTYGSRVTQGTVTEEQLPR